MLSWFSKCRSIGSSLVLLVASTGWFAVAAWAAVSDSRPPNVVIIYADDLGYGDVHCYNPDRCKIPTPRIDSLAQEGMRFTDAHSSSGVCTPSRYALLTGRYHWRTKLQAGIVGIWGDSLIAADRLTLGSLAQQHGYRTACIGKWHLGWDWPIERGDLKFLRGLDPAKNAPVPDPATQLTAGHREAWQRIFSKPIGGGPTARGFDVYFGTDVPNWPPYCFIENDRTVGIPTTLLPAADLEKQARRATNQGPALEGWRLEDVLPAIRDRAVRFVAESAAAKAPFLLYVPLTTPHTPLAVNDEWKGKSGLGPYGDLVMETDDAVGRVLDAIDAAGIADETLVIFASDNGCAGYIGAADLEKKGHFPSGPLRGYKASVFEGGHRVPFIVRWPGTVKPGSVCDQLVHQADVMATLADILGAKMPANAGEDSVSLLPLFEGGNTPVREHAVSCASAGIPGLRQGTWKYIPEPDPDAVKAGGAVPLVQLYDLAADIGEETNLAAREPERVASMAALLEKLIVAGRSTPGEAQSNDVEVRRYPLTRGN